MSTTDAARPLLESVHHSWAKALEPVEPQLGRLDEFLREEHASGRGYLPAEPHIMRAFERPLDAVRVLIVGQDPYPTPGHAVGLAFSVAPDVKPLPASLRNIFLELMDDQHVPQPSTGDLTPWVDQGVLLLNRVLTVGPGKRNGHRRKGWEDVTTWAIQARVERGGPLVAILWGRAASDLSAQLPGIQTVESPHPSPLSARHGFFGSRPFSRTNDLLARQGAEPVNWRLP